MGKNYRFFLSFVWIVLGAALAVCGGTGLIEDFWSSMGLALVIVGILQVIRNIRYRTNEDYREKFDTASKDERNRFIANKAWAWAGYLFVMVAAVGSIVFKLMGREDLMMLASGSVCLIMLLYWGSWMVLRKKY
jgi:hypothetical protein